MKNFILISICALFITGCSSTKFRNTAGVFNSETGEINLTYNNWLLLEQESKVAPWKFTLAQQYCNKSLPERSLFLNNYPLGRVDGENLKSAYRKTIKEANARFFANFACSVEYKSILQSLFDYYELPIYSPKLDWSEQNGISVLGVNGYDVYKYESILFKNRSKSYVKSLIQNPVFTNDEREQFKIALPQQNNETLLQLEEQKQLMLEDADEQEDEEKWQTNANKTLKLRSSELGSGECMITVKSNFNKKVLERFSYVCTPEGISPRFVQIEDNDYIIYAKHDYSELGLAYSLRLHKITPSEESENNNPRLVKKANESDRIILHFVNHNLKQSNVNYPPIPMDMDIVQQNDKYLLATIQRHEGKSQLVLYTFNQDFSQSTSIVVPVRQLSEFYIALFTTEEIIIRGQNNSGVKSQLLYNIASGEISQIENIKLLDKRTLDLEQEVHYFSAADGQKLPIVITHSKDFKKTNKSFGIVEGYGGFNSMTSSAVTSNRNEIYKNGGFTAKVIMRGDGDFGVDGWKEAFGARRVVSYSDFIKATEYLYSMGYAPKGRIASEGWSNGGLLVLVAAMMRPDLYGAVISGSPVTDLLNLKKIDGSNGEYWMESDYGDPKQSKDIKNFWQKYSPMQNYANSVKIPPTLLRTADDDRNVHLYHSVQLYRNLQKSKHASKTFLYVMPKGGGHGPASVKAKVEEYSYIYSFLFQHIPL